MSEEIVKRVRVNIVVQGEATLSQIGLFVRPNCVQNGVTEFSVLIGHVLVLDDIVG